MIMLISESTFVTFQQLKREAGKSGFLYEADVLTWTDIDFAVSYSVKFLSFYLSFMLIQCCFLFLDVKCTVLR